MLSTHRTIDDVRRTLVRCGQRLDYFGGTNAGPTVRTFGVLGRPRAVSDLCCLHGSNVRPVEAKFGGVKSIDPVNKKQKAPATFKFIAGPKDGDRGNVTFESVSNRGVGRVTVTFAVAAAGRSARVDHRSRPTRAAQRTA